MLTLFGAGALSFMMLMYALERRHYGYVAAFACGCALSSVYGVLAGVWPFGVVEAIWAVIALQRFRDLRRTGRRRPANPLQPTTGTLQRAAGRKRTR